MLRRGTPFTLSGLAAVGAATVLLAACSGETAGSADSARIGAVIKGLDNPFFQAMEDGITAQAKQDGATVTVQAAADISDTTGQADKLTTLAGQPFGCFVINPITRTNLIQSLAAVSQAGTPIVNIDSPLDAAAVRSGNIKVSAYIGTDNVAIGAKGGKYALSVLGDGEQVAIIGGTAGDSGSTARIDGFRAAVRENLDVLDTVAGDFSRDKALTAATTILAGNPKIAGFFTPSDDMGLGIAKAVQNAGLAGKVVIISVDGNKDALEAVKAGRMSATVAQYPYQIGALGVQACERLIAGKTIPDRIESPTAVVTSDNATEALGAFPAPFEPFTNPLD